MVPEEVIPVAPVIAPAEEMSMLVVSRAKVPLPPPMETRVFAVPVLMLVAELVFTLMLVAPVRVRPPVPCKSPVPEFTPTAVTAPPWVTPKLVEVIKLVPKVPERLMPLVTLVPVIFRASVTVIWLPVAVSLLARSIKEATVVSVEAELFCATLILAAVSLLPEIEVFWLNWMSTPAMEPVETAVVAWLLLIVKRLLLHAVLAAVFWLALVERTTV